MTNDAAVDVDRYDMFIESNGYTSYVDYLARADGDWVRYSDHATTVAELRARVEAAEQKLAEVVEAAIDFLEAADARDNEEVSTQYPDHEKRLRQYKAAREDLNAILPGPTP